MYIHLSVQTHIYQAYSLRVDTVNINEYIILSYSYFFMEFATHDQTVAAVNAGNGYRLDKSHIFSVYFFTDFEK